MLSPVFTVQIIDDAPICVVDSSALCSARLIWKSCERIVADLWFRLPLHIYMLNALDMRTYGDYGSLGKSLHWRSFSHPKRKRKSSVCVWLFPLSNDASWTYRIGYIRFLHPLYAFGALEYCRVCIILTAWKYFHSSPTIHAACFDKF